MGHRTNPSRPTTKRQDRTAAPPRRRETGLLDINQAAQLLNTTPRFIRRLVQERRIAYLKVGRYIRFDPDDLDTWIDNCRHTPLA